MIYAIAAAVMSALWPGLGQLFNREFPKGIGLMSFAAICWWYWFGFIPLILLIATYIYATRDAYRAAMRRNTDSIYQTG